MKIGKLGQVNVVLADTVYELYKLTDADSFSIVTVHITNRNVVNAHVGLGIKNAANEIVWIEEATELFPKAAFERTSIGLSTGDTLVIKSSINQMSFVCTGSQSNDTIAATAAPALAFADNFAAASPAASAQFGETIVASTSFIATSSIVEGEVDVKTVDGQALFTATNPLTNTPGDLFGHAIAINDYYVAIGSPGAEGSSSETNAGKVFIFESFTGTLVHTISQPVIGADAVSGEQVNGYFGSSVAMDYDNNKLYIGAKGHDNDNGAVFRFVLSTGVYDSARSVGGDQGQMGTSLVLNTAGTALYSGSPARFGGGGAVIPITTSNMIPAAGSNWLTFPAAAGVTGVGYGTKLHINDTFLIVGAPNSSVEIDGVDTANVGAAGLVKLSDVSETLLLAPANERAQDLKFGHGIAVNSELAWVGAPGYNNNQGKAYAISLNPGEIVADMNSPSDLADEFGTEIEATDAMVLAAAPKLDVGANSEAGRVYTYRQQSELFTSRSVATTLARSAASIEQSNSFTITVSVTLPFADKSGFSIPWSLSGYTDVIATASPTSGSGTTNASGQFTVTFATKDRSDLDFYDDGAQTVTFGTSGQTISVTIQPVPDALYDFTTHTFTTASKTGRTAHSSISSYISAYSSAGSWKNNVDYFVEGYDNGYQRWTVPSSTTYTIRAAGAEGYRGGRGAVIERTVALEAGDKLDIVCGHTPSGGSTSTGGGGASWVVQSYDAGTGTTYTQNNAQAILIAGGGGGTYSSTNQGGARSDASYTTTSKAGTGESNGNTGPTNPRQATNNSPYGGTGGSFASDGPGATNCGNSGAEGWRTGLSGGGTCSNSEGAFGGGAGTHGNSGGGGGGGGYAGGGGCGHTNGGGGGGSCFPGTGANQTNVAYNSSSGYVTITKN